MPDQRSPEVLRLARQLSRAMTECDEMEELRQAELEVLNDDELQAMLTEVLEKQDRLRLGQYDTVEEGTALRQRVTELERALAAHPTYFRYTNARKRVERLTKSVLNILSFSLTGHEQQGGCMQNHEAGPAGVISCQKCGKTSVPVQSRRAGSK